MLQQIKFLQTQKLNDEVIDEIAAFFLTKYYLGQETSAAQVGELARYELVGGGWRNSFEFLKGVREVTPAQVMAVSNKYMKNIRFAVVAHCDGKGEARFLHILGYVFRGIIVVNSNDGQPFVLQFSIKFLENWELLPARRTCQIPKVDQVLREEYGSEPKRKGAD